MKRVRALAVASIIAVVAPACGASGPDIQVAARKPIESLDVRVPDSIAGLRVRKENIKKTLVKADPSYVGAVSLYSLRQGSTLQATFEIGRFRPETRDRRAAVERDTVNRIGGTQARPLPLGGDLVYVAVGNKQRIAVWFRGEYLFILAMRDDVARWRSLLRAALEVRP